MDERIMKKLKVYLHGVGQNLNMAYRTCEFFGVKEIFLHECKGKLKGNLFKAKDKIKLKETKNMPVGSNVLYLETNGRKEINEVDFSEIDTFCIGGETNDFLNKKFKHIEKAKINGLGDVSGLTVTAALAIVLNKKVNDEV